MTEKSTHFGYEDVDWNDKQQKVKGVFDSVASNYDIMNDVMSFGMHRLWKRFAVDVMQPKPGQAVLDLACGSCDLSVALAKRVGDTGTVVASDINAAMMAQGQERIVNEGLLGRVQFSQVNAEAIPFDDSSFDIVSIGFGLRNVTDKDKALAEMARVLKPGGRAMILEFSKPTNPVLGKIYDTYSFSLLPKMGKFIAKDEASYQYLAESIRKHPNQATLTQMMKDAGFDEVDHHNLTGGVVAVHRGLKC
jgi:demethylmenaquinone methyltransferase / 2-methoxy-6-polyprenyl-1,4-benzoquinol methylase